LLNHLKNNSHLVSGAMLTASIFLWVLSCLQTKTALLSERITGDLAPMGLFSILSPPFYMAFSILIASFLITLLFTKKNRLPLFIIQTSLLIIFLNFTPAFVEGTARFTTSYLNYQATDYIIQTGRLDPGSIWIHNWPSFSIVISAFAQLTGISGQSILLIYPTIITFFIFMVLLVFFKTVFDDYNLIWLSIWFVLLGNWVGQEYFSMQSLAFVFVIIVLFLLFKSMKQKVQLRNSVLLLLLLVFFVVSSHLLSSLALFCVILVLFISKSFPRFIIMASVGALVVVWTIFNAMSYFAKSLSYTLGQFLNVSFIISTNLTNRMGGDLGHVITTEVRLIYSLAMLTFALVGLLSVSHKMTVTDKRILYVLLGFILLIFAFAYGGELFMRLFMFSLIPLSYFASKALLKHKRLLFVGVFFFVIFTPPFVMIAHYGNEVIDYVPLSETVGAQFLYASTVGGQVVGGSMRSGDFRDLTYRLNYEEISLRDLYLNNGSNSLFTQPHDPYSQRFLCLSYETGVFFSSYMGDSQFSSSIHQNLSQSISYNLVYSNPSFEIYNSKPLN
jgi:hypothetical protein